MIYIYILSSFTDDAYGVWTEWSKCSKSCGKGVKKRARACTKPFPSGGGRDRLLLETFRKEPSPEYQDLKILLKQYIFCNEWEISSGM